MSDYEGDWPNEEDWEKPKPQVIPAQAAAPPDPYRNYIAPRGTSALEVQELARAKPRRTNRTTVQALPQSYRPTLQSFRPQAANATHGVLKHVQIRVLELEAFKLYQQNKDNPSDKFHMFHSLHEIAKQLPRHTDLHPREVVRDELAKICVSTNAFIEVPSDESTSLKIWGTPEQVSQAIVSLKAWEMHHKAPGKDNAARGPHKAWTKQNALDGRQEHRDLRVELASQDHANFQQFADDATLPYEAHIIWPEDYDFEGFVTEYDNDVLEPLRRKYRCIIRHHTSDPRVTQIACETQQIMFHVHNRLLGLLKELVSKKRRGLRITQCHFPAEQEYRDRVELVQIDVGGKKFSTPQLVGPSLATEDQHWVQLSTEANRKYRNATKKALQSCLKSLHVSRCHVLMRVSFGSIALAEYQRASNGQNTYFIDEFINMVQNPRVTVIQCPLSSTASSFGLVDRIEALDAFGSPEYSWALHFDFAGEQNSSLRLEKEFSVNPADPESPSTSATRWLIYSDQTNSENVTELLEINHMNVGQVGNQFHIGAARLLQNSRIKTTLRSFENSIEFQPPPIGLRFPPQKHAVFPFGSENLRTVKELTIAKYPFKQTKGTFELRRIDTFFQGRVFEASSVPQQTEWHANYYYEEWDILMSQLANIEPGQDVDWKRELITFFPKVMNKDYPRALPAGFKNLMKEVTEIQTLLTTAVGPIDSIQSADCTGVKGH